MTAEPEPLPGPDASRQELEDALDECLVQIREDAQAVWRFASRAKTGSERIVEALPVAIGLHLDPSARSERLRMIADRFGEMAPYFDRLARLNTAGVIGSSAEQLASTRADAEQLLRRLLAPMDEPSRKDGDSWPSSPGS